MGLPQKFRKAAFEAEQTGGFFHRMTRHFACHYPRWDTLVVTFDNMKSRDQPLPHYPWGFAAMEKLGVSHLGVMMLRRNDWFRHADLFDFFDDLKARRFFDGYRRVIYYGSSMGGFAACTFASAAPGADVLALMPQSTLAPDLVPFEHRYSKGRARGDWKDPRYRDGAEGIATARRAALVYDPYFAPDRAHANRLTGENVQHLKCHFAGHKAARLLHISGLLQPTLTTFVRETALSEEGFQQSYRDMRRRSSMYRRLVKAAWQQRVDQRQAGSARVRRVA